MAAKVTTDAETIDREDIENRVVVDAKDLAQAYEVSEQAMSIRLSSLGIRLWHESEDQRF